MRTLWSRGFSQIAVACLMAMTVPAAADQTVRYAGTIRSITSGSLVLEDVGPWHGEKSATVITPRTIVLAPSTEFFVASRAEDGATRFPGDYQEVPAQRSDLKPGTFVSVECQPTREGCQSLKVTMVRMTLQTN